ncbi:MAG: hypothetical protein ACKOAF_00225 [Actinomycetes bacterium]
MASPAGPLRAAGRWLAPVTSGPEQATRQLRTGIVGVLFAVLWAAAILTAFALMYSDIGDELPSTDVLLAGLILVAISVFTPQALFRTGTESSTKQILASPTQPIAPWSTSTISFNAILVGAMLAGLYAEPVIAFLLFSLAYLIRMTVLTKRESNRDPNSRFHQLSAAFAAMLIASIAYSIVRPLATAVTMNFSIIPLLLAGIMALYLGLILNAVDRWARCERRGWAAARDLIDVRRLLVAAVSAVIAWTVAATGEILPRIDGDPTDTVLPALAALGVFLACWLLLWAISISVWRIEAKRTLALWRSKQSVILTRLADGSLDPELAAKAALNVTGRMGAVVFGATQVLTIHDAGGGGVSQSLVRTDVYPGTSDTLPTSPSGRSGLRIPLGIDSRTTSSITISDCLLPGRFLTRSRALVDEFSELATIGLLSPELRRSTDRDAIAFASMFDSGWPSMSALDQAMLAMRERFDRAPHLSSLIVGVYAINEFAALAGGRHEHAAISHVMRSALSSPLFNGTDVFVAYESPGRVWVAVSGGPIIRNTIQLLRDLQDSLNSFGRAASSATDLEVFVSVSFGYAAHQVDDLSPEGLIQTARDRLAADQSARNPLSDPDFSTLELTPELFTRVEPTPVTVDSLLEGMTRDRGTAAFISESRPLLSTAGAAPEGTLVSVGWVREFRYFDMRQPENLLKAVNRQPHLAALAAEISLDALTEELTTSPLCIIRMPSALLHPEAGELALPNLIVPKLDRSQCQRTVLLFDEIPVGGGETLRMLADRGLNIAVTAAAAASANSGDLSGWSRWAIVFPPHVMQGTHGADELTISQTASAGATSGTRLIAMVSESIDMRVAQDCGISAVIFENAPAHERVELG